MSGQSGEGDPVSVDGDAASWVRERAAQTDLGPAEFLERIVAAVRAAENGEPAATAAEVSRLADRLEDLDGKLDDRIEDVRDRVVQVKRETDRKAPADHDHGDLAADVERVETVAEGAQTAVDDLEETVDRLQDRLERGFENYEEILRYLVDETDELAADARSLSDAIEAMGRSHRTIRAREERRRRTESIKTAANRAGVTAAVCEDCGSEVQVGLLAAPECPFCGADVSGVTATPGFFGSATLETGAPPALEDPSGSAVSDLEEVEVSAGDRDDRPTVPDAGETTVDVEAPGEATDGDRRGETDG
ncbi:MAG: hypothetical protein ABEJ77_01570 [Halanaeroarchaeum sp.]